MLARRIPTEKELRAVKVLGDYPTVRVECVDAVINCAWDTVAAYVKHKCVDCVSVGFLTKNTKTEIQVVQSINSLGKVLDSMTIPKAWVKNVRVL